MVNPLGSPSTSSNTMSYGWRRVVILRFLWLEIICPYGRIRFLEYGAITTWGSVFLNLTLKPSHIH